MHILVILPQEIVRLCYQSGVSAGADQPLINDDLINARYYVRRAFRNPGGRSCITYVELRLVLRRTEQDESIERILKKNSFDQLILERSLFTVHSITPGITYVLHTPELSLPCIP